MEIYVNESRIAILIDQEREIESPRKMWRLISVID